MGRKSRKTQGLGDESTCKGVFCIFGQDRVSGKANKVWGVHWEEAEAPGVILWDRVVKATWEGFARRREDWLGGVKG